VEKIGQPGNVERVEKVYLEEGPVADMIAIEGNPFDQGDMCNVCGFSVVGVAMIANRQGMVD
jgi:hypothetical protein